MRFGIKHLRSLVRRVVIAAQLQTDRAPSDKIAFPRHVYPECDPITRRNSRAAVWVFQALIVDNEAFTEIFGEIAVCPLAELHATDGSDAETYCQNHFQ